jgi:hypothetical protein
VSRERLRRLLQVAVVGAGGGDAPLALDQLVRGALGPDGLADPPGRAAAAVERVHEVAPGGEDPGRVGADVGDVGERHPVGVAAEGRPQQPDLGRAHHHQHRLAGGDPLPDEREGSGQEVDLPGVQQRLVSEGLNGLEQGGSTASNSLDGGIAPQGSARPARPPAVV